MGFQNKMNFNRRNSFTLLKRTALGHASGPEQTRVLPRRFHLQYAPIRQKTPGAVKRRV
jgi:hypothetical protein